MPTYRVKAGRELPHGGTVIPGGKEVELTAELAHEVRHLVDELDPVTGDLKAVRTSQDEAAFLDELARSRPHERVTLIEQAIAANTADRTKLEGLLAEAKAAEAKPAAPKPPHEHRAPAPAATDKK